MRLTRIERPREREKNLRRASSLPNSRLSGSAGAQVSLVLSGAATVAAFAAANADIHSGAPSGSALFPLIATGGLATVLISGLVMVLRLASAHKKQAHAEEQATSTDEEDHQ